MKKTSKKRSPKKKAPSSRASNNGAKNSNGSAVVPAPPQPQMPAANQSQQARNAFMQQIRLSQQGCMESIQKALDQYGMRLVATPSINEDGRIVANVILEPRT